MFCRRETSPTHCAPDAIFWYPGVREQKSPCHRTVRQGVGAEEKSVNVEVIGEYLREGISGLWRTFVKCDGIQVSGKGDDGGLL